METGGDRVATAFLAEGVRRSTMFIGDSIRPLSLLEDLELRHERLAELIALDLVSPTLRLQIHKALLQLEQQILALKNQTQKRAAA